MTWAEEENDDYNGFNTKDVIYFYVCLKWLIVGPGGLSAPPDVAFAMRTWPLLLPTFGLSLLSVFCFWPTSGKLPRLNICSPQYFGTARRNMHFFCCNLYLFYEEKNTDFWVFFLLFMASVQLRPPGPPQVPGVLVQACLRAPLRHPWWRTKRSCFGQFFLFFFFSSMPSAFHPLQGNSRDWKFIFPHILA